jgi:hypothetical protein
MIRAILSLLKFFLLAVPLACLLYVTLFFIYKIKGDAKPQRMD